MRSVLESAVAAPRQFRAPKTSALAIAKQLDAMAARAEVQARRLSNLGLHKHARSVEDAAQILADAADAALARVQGSAP